MKKGVDYIGVGVGAMIFNERGKVFISQRGPKSKNEIGKWDFPGGGVEFGETCEKAIIREMKEEFNIRIEIIELLHVVNHIIPEEKQHWVSPSFVAKHVSGEAQIMEPEKCSGYKWIELDEVPNFELTLASAQDYKKYTQVYGSVSPKKTYNI